MAARTPRKLFASPFVITLAASCSAPQQPPPNVNPPPPEQPSPSPSPDVGVISNPPRPGTDPSPSPSQAPGTFNSEQRWTVSKSGANCMAMAKVECPKPAKPGGPMPTCNPPPPIKYACPDGFDGKEALQIVQRANDTECYVDRPMPSCPPKAMCNPPPPQKVACPHY